MGARVFRMRSGVLKQLEKVLRSLLLFQFKGEMRMAKRKWAYKPGEISNKKAMEHAASFDEVKLQKFLDLTDVYSNMSQSKRTLVLNDNKELVFFIQMDDSMTRTKQTDVFVWDGEDYVGLSHELSNLVATKYFDYLDVVGDAYESIEEGGIF